MILSLRKIVQRNLFKLFLPLEWLLEVGRDTNFEEMSKEVLAETL